MTQLWLKKSCSQIKKYVTQQQCQINSSLGTVYQQLSRNSKIVKTYFCVCFFRTQRTSFAPSFKEMSQNDATWVKEITIDSSKLCQKRERKKKKTEIFARRFSHPKNAFRVIDGCSQEKNEVNDLLLSAVVIHISPGSILNKSYLLFIRLIYLLLYLDPLAFRKQMYKYAMYAH